MERPTEAPYILRRPQLASLALTRASSSSPTFALTQLPALLCYCAACHATQDGKLPLHIAVQEGASAELLALLASCDMPVFITGNLVVEHSHSWSFLVAQDSDECSNAVALLLAPTTDSPAGYDYGQHVEALAEVLGQGGQKVLQIAKNGPRQAIYKHLLSGYEVIVM